MSEGETVPEANDGDDGGLFCSGLSPTMRKLFYYLTFLLGVVAFVYGFIRLFSGEVAFICVGSSLILICPFWVKSFSLYCSELKKALRLTSAIIFLLCLIGTVTFALMDEEVISIIFGVLLGLSGIWYFLSFFENGQKACIECAKACCCCSEK